jgi:hypothetical protein
MDQLLKNGQKGQQRTLKPVKDCLSWSIFITQLLKQWPERPKMNDKVKKAKKAKKAKNDR